VRVDPFPSGGYQFRVGSDVATPFIGSGDRYLRFLGDGSIYRRLRGSAIVQLRLMAGTFVNGVLDSDRGFIPPEKLFYGGGPTTVRGFRRNGLGPVIYVKRPSLDDDAEGDSVKSDTVASAAGGRRIVVSTVELTVPAPFWRDRLRLAGFVDGGRVWDPASPELRDPGFRITPGVGVRYATPVGPFRFDVAYNGYPQTPGPLYEIDRKGDIVGKIADDFVPDRALSFWKRLVVHVSIGQTF